MTVDNARVETGVLKGLVWDNVFTRMLPGDTEPSNRRRQVHHVAYSAVHPTPVSDPRIIAISAEAQTLLGIDGAANQSENDEIGNEFGDALSDEFAQVFSGNRIPAGAAPFAMCYGGHQFGNWAGQLGDGRAITIGEVRDIHGTRQSLQLKGAGPTPYSRSADGRAVLRSSIREFLCSEAMHHLGIPTTRALSLVLTGDAVVRDMLYNGNPAPEPGAIVCRVAPSFVRFGSFQLPASRDDIALLRQLVEYTIREDFAHLLADDSVISEEVIVAWFSEVCTRTTRLVIDWMRVGFVHGVLNTDNMSILGLTIDYGPYGWLENFDPGWTPNTTDASGRRYRYGAQPQIIHWNLVQLANALVPLLGDTAPLQAVIDTFPDRYTEQFRAMMCTRLGWGLYQGDVDDELVQQLWAVLTATEVDQVLFYRHLAHVPTHESATDNELLAPLNEAWYLTEEITGDVAERIVTWLRSWSARVRSTGTPDHERIAVMNTVNPLYVLRNYLAQEIIDAATGGDYAPIAEMLEVLRHPYTEQAGRERFAMRRPDWARHRVGCSMLSCSS